MYNIELYCHLILKVLLVHKLEYPCPNINIKNKVNLIFQKHKIPLLNVYNEEGLYIIIW